MPELGSLPRKFEVNLAISGSGGIIAPPAAIAGTGQVVSVPLIDNTAHVFPPTIIVGPKVERVALYVHFEHMVKTWRSGDGFKTTPVECREPR